jgi:hypothetical protein
MKPGIRVSVLVAVSACSLWAQSTAGGGAISGFILEGDIDGLPQAIVTVSNSNLSVRRVATTTDEGAFDVLSLPPGPGYQIKVEFKGFANWESASFPIMVGQTLSVRIAMQREKAATNVDLASVMSQVPADQAGLGTWISPAQLAALPSSRQLLDSLITLSPGTAVDPATGRLSFLSTTSTAFLQDGINVGNSYFGNRSPLLTTNATQEFQVLASTYPAEFGRAMGGVVNAVSPTGGNNFHGGVYGYLRPGDWSETERFAQGQNLLGDRNQMGVNFGGPIRSNRLFFFANFERMTDHFQGLNRITSPTLVDSSGNLAASNCTATAAQCAAIKFISGQMNVLSPFSQNWTSGLARVDYRRSEVNTIHVEFNAMNQSSPEAARRQLVAPNGGLMGLQNATEDTRYGRLNWTAAPTPGWFSELRAGLVEDRWLNPASAAGLSTGNIAITVAGATVGNPNPSPSRLNEKRYQFVENMTWTSGAHTVRLGGDISRTRDDVDSLQSAGAYNYPTLTAFAQDFSGGTTRSYTNFTQQFGTSAHTVPYRELTGYAQDTWKALPRVSITTGVRWEKALLPQPSVIAPGYYSTGTIPSSNTAFSPRVSLGYLVNDTTVLRAGFGFFYLPYSGQFIDTLLEGNGLSQTSVTVNPNQTNAPLFPHVLTFTSTPAGSSNLIYAMNKLRDPHARQISLALEKQVAHATTATLTLISSRAVKLWTGADQNLTTPIKTLTYPIDDAGGVAVGSYTTNVWTAKNDSKSAQTFQVENGGSSRYDAAAFELRQRMTHGLSFQASYTWSHATGTNTGPLYSGIFPLTSVPGDNTVDKGSLPTDQRHRAVFNWTWQPMLLHGDGVLARYVVNGWRFSGIATLASDLPVAPVLLLTGNQSSTLSMTYFNSLNGSGGWARVPFLAVDSYHTDAQRNVDVRLTRTVPFTERLRGEVAIEAFNVFNRQPIIGLNTIAFTAVATLPPGLINGPYSGVLKPVTGAGSGNSSSSYPDGTTARRAQISFRLVF